MTDRVDLAVYTLISINYGKLNYSESHVPQFPSKPSRHHCCRPHAAVTCNYKSCALGVFSAYLVHISCVCLQPSSTLSGYVSACAYSPTNQYGVYSGPAGGYVAPGHHHWQPQSPALSHPGSGMGMHAGEIHSPMTFKHQAREGRQKGDTA